MSTYSLALRLIDEITGKLYPQLQEQLENIQSRKQGGDYVNLESVFDIYDDLKQEFLSLSRYETKLVFPGFKKVFNDGNGTAPSNVRMNELKDLLKRKEDLIREIVMGLDVELQAYGINEEEDSLLKLVSFFKEKYFCTKTDLYRTLALLQRERLFLNNDAATPDLLTS